VYEEKMTILEKANNRRKLMTKAHDWLMRKSMPRVQMCVMVCATGISAFLFSAFLLKMGITQMHIRYLLATIFAYIIFLLFIWLWIEYYRRKVSVVERNNNIDITDTIDIANLDPSLMDSSFAPHANFFEGGSSGGGGAGGSFDSGNACIGKSSGSDSVSHLASIDFDFDDAIILVVLIAAVCAALFSGLYLIYTAPALLTEVLLDGVLSYGLYRKLTKLDQENWLEGVVKRTIIPFAIAGVFFFVAGIVITHYLPGSDSIGDVIAHFKN
jgi:hypothetical protein